MFNSKRGPKLQNKPASEYIAWPQTDFVITYIQDIYKMEITHVATVHSVTTQ